MAEQTEVVKKTQTINTVQHSVYVKRLSVPRMEYNYNWYIPYDADNMYPNKIRSIAERSVTTMTAIWTHSDFLGGQGFGEAINKIIVNREQATMLEVEKSAAKQQSMFNGIALHFNYNRLGQIVEVNVVPFDGVRWARDMKSFFYSPDWSQVAYRNNRDVFEYKPFNPDNAISEINEVGIENYTGQLFYWIPSLHDIYPVCRFDAAANFAQFEDESSIHQLRSIQNDYAIGGLIKLPRALFNDKDESDTTENLTVNFKGAQNANAWMMIPITNEEHFKGKFFESTTRQNIDGFFKTQNEQAKSNIYEMYQQPPILNGKSFGGIFNQEQFIDSFDYYNSKTQDERDSLQKVFNRFWKYTIWSKGEDLVIIPKEYIQKREVANGSTY